MTGRRDVPDALQPDPFSVPEQTGVSCRPVMTGQAAHDEAVARLAAIVRAPVRYRRPASEVDPAKLGLDPAVATLEVDGVVLKFGTTDAIRNDRYVEFNGTIALVPDRFSALLFATPESETAPARE